MNNAVIIVIVVIVGLVLYLFYSYKKMAKSPLVENHEDIKVLTDATFAKEIQKGVVLVDFWAAWCMPCKMIAPVLNEIASELKGVATIAKIDIDKNQQFAGKYQVRSIPTLIIFKNGVEVNRLMGVKPKSVLLSEVKKYL